jgi:putative hydrolase of the HAD superfamily
MVLVKRQNLIIDADDTLWENNIYFLRAFDEFVDFLDHSTLSPTEVRAVLDEIESVNSRIHGYGSLNFGHNMQECYRNLCEREIRPEDLEVILGFAERIMQQPVELMDGVLETLETLASRHSLTLFTKGHPEEQKLKIDQSGLGVFFGHTAIVKEKDAGSYRRLVQERSLQSADTWMIGNSPRSDVNPALEAGINAVFVPHPETWTLEREELRTGPGRLLQLGSFRELTAHF